MKARRIRIKYSQINIEEMVAWLELNNYQYALVPDATQYGTIEDLALFLEVYTEEAEVAARLTWETE